MLVVPVGDVGDLLLSGVEPSSPSQMMPLMSHMTILPKPMEMSSLPMAMPAAPGPVDDDLHLPHLLAGHPHGVEQGGGHHDGGAVLVVVEHGDVAHLLQAALHLEAAGGGRCPPG